MVTSDSPIIRAAAVVAVRRRLRPALPVARWPAETHQSSKRPADKVAVMRTGQRRGWSRSDPTKMATPAEPSAGYESEGGQRRTEQSEDAGGQRRRSGTTRQLTSRRRLLLAVIVAPSRMPSMGDTAKRRPERAGSTTPR